MIRRFWNLFYGWREFGIKKNELVLDVGSGDNPCFRADVICDKHIEDSSQRSGRMKIQIYPHQKLVAGDAQFLPFKDKSFDFVICRHLLEHLDDPGRGVEELMRVAHRGYIETPSALMEILYGWSFHKWLVQFTGGKIIFSRKDKNQTYGILSEKIKKDRNFERLVRSQPDMFRVRYRWEGEISYQVEYSGEVQDKSLKTNFRNESGCESILTPRSRFKNFVLRAARFFWSRPRFNLLDILACPACKDKDGLRQESNGLVCPKCRQAYQTRGGIPMLLPK